MGTHITEDDGYQQGIIAFDQYMRDLIKELDLVGRLDETVVILYTDHGHNNASNVRTPLMFRFPGGEHARRITSNTQNLDIAPTILEYMGIQPPGWMMGQSLLQKDPPAARPIFNTRPNYRVEIDERLQLDTSKTKPPFYQFGVINMVVCQKWYGLGTDSLTWTEGEVAGYPTPCDASKLPNLRQAQEIIVKQLEEDGFDTTSLKETISR
jgi:predicted AlkP superfamily pyrophosphatase or phosphodiesterase